MTRKQRLSIYDLQSAGRVEIVDTTTANFVFVVDGVCRLENDADGAHEVTSGLGAAVAPGAAVTVDGTVWLCETAPANSPLLAASLARVVQSTAFDGPAAHQALFRIDRIDLGPGARTPRHFHRGPGIRRLLHGRVRVEIGDDVIGVDPGGAWFEPGDDPVVGANDADGDSAFLRVSLLPVDLIGGKSSFIPATDAEAVKPRAVDQKLLHETIVDLA